MMQDQPFPSVPTQPPLQQGGTIPVGEGEFGHAFEYCIASPCPLPVILAVPHAGRAYPPDVLAAMRQPELAAIRLEDRLVDMLAQAVVQTTGVGLLIARAPRAMIDLNRDPMDIDWDMLGLTALSPPPPNARARSGLGLIPRRLPQSGEIWRGRLTRDVVEARIAAIHTPYHLMLSEMMEHLRHQWGAALLIDLHSMPSLPPDMGAAQMVLGDRFGAACDAGLIAGAMRKLGDLGCLVAHNRPYAGGYVLDRHGQPRRGLHAIQIEIDRAAYLDSALTDLGEGAALIVERLAQLVWHMARDVAHLGGQKRLLQAAE